MLDLEAAGYTGKVRFSVAYVVGGKVAANYTLCHLQGQSSAGLHRDPNPDSSSMAPLLLSRRIIISIGVRLRWDLRQNRGD